MNKFFIILFLPLYIYAHTLLLSLMDNEDGTITVKGVFSTGQSASGALVKLQALDSNGILFQKRLDDDSELIVKIPEVPYNVILDGGPGHSVSKEGIAPKGGFKKGSKSKDVVSNTKALSTNSDTLMILVAISIILFFATIFISIYNTNKLVKKLKKV